MGLTEMTLPRDCMDPTWICRVCFEQYPVLTQAYPLSECWQCGSRHYEPGPGHRGSSNRARSFDPDDHRTGLDCINPPWGYAHTCDCTDCTRAAEQHEACL